MQALCVLRHFTKPDTNALSCESVEMIIESLKVVAHRDTRTQLQAALTFLLGPTRVESGCLSCQLYQDVGDPNKFHFESCWTSEADLAHHLRSETCKQLLIALELSSEPPLIQFHTISKTDGLDLIRSTRERTGDPPRNHRS